MACFFFCPLLYVKKILCDFEIRGAQGPPHVKFPAHKCIERGRYPHARSSMPVNCPIKGFLFLESHTIEVLLTLLWEFGTFVQPNYVFTSTLCYLAKKILNVTKRSSSILTLLLERTIKLRKLFMKDAARRLRLAYGWPYVP